MKVAIRILLADDDDALRRVIEFKLKQKKFAVTAVEDGRKALEQLKQNSFDLLLTDMKMPGLSGIELLEQSKTIRPDLQVILITAHATVTQAVQAVKLGAFDYLTKPFEDEQLFVAIDKALRFRQLADENKYLRGRLQGNDFLSKIVGISRPFKDMMQLIEKIAPTDATVLITGESGTGKELVARAIHCQSGRSQGRFVAVNCAAIPKELIESELFGHTRGAFTGAVRDKKGKFELAAGGTLLLDEIGELSVELQAKLLRVVQERVIEPLGSEEQLEIDVRLLAATNQNLRKRVADGSFREDLFYRLNVIPVAVPPLRERVDDIPVLVHEFLKKFSKDKQVTIDNQLMDRLANHNWPGNIRELENMIERIVILRQTDRLTLADLPDDFNISDHGRASAPTAPELTFHEAEEKIIMDALQKCEWNRTRAAKLLNIPRHVLIYRMKKYGLKPEGQV